MFTLLATLAAGTTMLPPTDAEASAAVRSNAFPNAVIHIVACREAVTAPGVFCLADWDATGQRVIIKPVTVNFDRNPSGHWFVRQLTWH